MTMTLSHSLDIHFIMWEHLSSQKPCLYNILYLLGIKLL